MHEIAYSNLFQHQIAPSEIWDTTWPEYLLAIISFQDQSEEVRKSDEPVDGRGALQRILQARDRVTSR